MAGVVCRIDGAVGGDMPPLTNAGRPTTEVNLGQRTVLEGVSHCRPVVGIPEGYIAASRLPVPLSHAGPPSSAPEVDGRD
jgi:hypothetical protein